MKYNDNGTYEDIVIKAVAPGRNTYSSSTSEVYSCDYVNAVSVPIGTINAYAGSTAPTHWLICDGSAVSRTTYAALFSTIGTVFGTGDGSTTFNLPNLKGKVITGVDSNDTDFDTLGETGGEKKHTLTIDEIPSHYHQVNAKTGSLTSGTNAAGVAEQSSASTYWDKATKSVGGGQSHNILQPYITLNYIIKAN